MWGLCVGVIMYLRFFGLVFLLTGLATCTSGCLAVAVGAGAAGTVAYMKGDLEAEEPYDIEKTYAAARTAVEELKLKIIESQTGADALSARVVARDSSDKKVEVRLKAITSNTTKLSVRVGTFGNDGKERRIYNTIRDHLKASAKKPEETPSASGSPEASTG